MRILTLLCLFCAVLAQDKVVFFDDFDDFDMKVWEHEITLAGGGNWEFQYYINNRSNTYVRDGVLYLQPTLTEETTGDVKSAHLSLWGGQPGVSCTDNSFYGCERTGGLGGNVLNPIQSARVRTAYSFSFKYGRMEVVAKLPRGDWLWPAIWLLPRNADYGNWPASGEIDIIESRGNVNYPSNPGGVNYVGTTLNWAPHYFFREKAWNLTRAYKEAPAGQDWATNFHTFGLFWNESIIYTYVDDDSNRILEVPITESFFDRGQYPAGTANPWIGGGKNAPFDQEFFIVLNVAVGGTSGYFPDGMGNKPWSDNDPHSIDAFYAAKNAWYPTWKGEDAAMKIDKVTVWQSASAIKERYEKKPKVLV